MITKTEMMEAVNAVIDLNEIICHTLGDDTVLLFDINTDGFSLRVNWAGLQVWSDEDDERIYNEQDDSYETFDNYLRRKFSFLQDRICKINLYKKYDHGTTNILPSREDSESNS